MNLELPDAITQARAIIQTDVASKVPGLAVAVMMDGALAWSEQFGHADLTTKTPITATTRFRIGSVSKPLTAAGLALLVERGQLDLDAPIQKYIPDFPQKDGVITTRLLAGHLSGIRNYRGLEACSNKPFPNLRSGLKVFENDPLESPPRAKFSYTSYNWNTIGVIMEAAAKQDFLSFMEENVLKPLGLNNTVPDRAGVPDSQRTQFYEVLQDGQFHIAPPVDLSFCWPAGGYLSTAEDMVRFGAMHLRPGFLKPESIKLLFISQATDTGALTNYGVGWFTRENVWYHGGDSAGGTAILMLVPARRIAIGLATNCGHGFLLNSIRKKMVAQEQVAPFLFVKEAVALKIAKVFAQLSRKSPS
jgi:serine beta-lactamase-like protein LACTB, mitochondrial